ncbi:sigma E protease regulator RseP [Sansalvadorimonas sp. 2012CJ34-2]|uniref:Zinc metalloprotease n=1 Tax=Parendozoicomonas callyspongiae TaxID=2942213 RepID=A0ABT0PKU7_9GAMM|nr:sigma E protease regulator RseP [Sansalvadorimonas sp. 2012CJ34-2]MCL6271995.1 sigma E protease regulator RseP [Sansalvadorimonas sp. 2012CJ34-2]
MDSIQTILAFIVTLGLLVSIHEYGHFWVARRCGIKVLRFSVGFGKPLFTWRDRQDTEYVIAAIPLGGYVKMLDEREGDVAEEERHLSFNSKPVLARIAVVAAGPIANFLLAIAALWIMYMIGIRALVPVVGEIAPGSLAAQSGIVSGAEIVAVDGRETRSWHDVNMALLRPVGESRSLDLSLRQFEKPSAAPYSVTVNIQSWLLGEEQPNPVRALGIAPWTPSVPAIIGKIVPDGAADKAGLRASDEIISMQGQPVTGWNEWVELIRENAGNELSVEVRRDGRLENLQLIPGEKELADGTKIGYIGAGSSPYSWPEEYIRDIRFGPVAALGVAAADTASLSTLMLDSLGKMVTGLVSVSNLSGPITIAKAAGASVKSGVESFLSFLAMLSVSLGVINLLPVPVLDGGHLLYHFVELLRGKPLSEKMQMFGMRIGLALILGIMFVALFNDLSRL